MYKKPPNYTKNDFGDLVSRRALLHWIREFIERCDLQGEYWEFGVYHGESMKETYFILRDVVDKYVGFDSFSGLPAPSSDPDKNGAVLQPQLKESEFCTPGLDFVRTNILSTGLRPQMLELVGGFFSETLTPDLQRKYLANCSKPIVIHMDVDYYESTLEALEFCYPFLQKGCWILFDDYWLYAGSTTHGTQLAIRHFLERHKDVVLQEYTCYRGWSKSFVVDIV